MLKEKVCPYCKRTFFYDAKNDDSFTELADTGEIFADKSSCVICVDPNALPMCTYLKTTLYSGYRFYLRSTELGSTELGSIAFEDETIQGMMFEQFPQTKSIWEGTTFRTFTIFPDVEFQNREFTLGVPYEKEVPRRTGPKAFVRRYIKCNRCDKQTHCNKFMAMCYYIGFAEKICFKCDGYKIPRHGSGIFTVRHTGGVQREDSMRAKAKALNVSVNDLRRGITQSAPVLPIGTMIKGLEIIGTYYDERKNRYNPCYLLQCPKCKGKFGIEQKRIETIFHKC